MLELLWLVFLQLRYNFLLQIGFPSVGKSTFLSTVTDTESVAASYEFTTLTCIPGVINHEGAKIQLLDLPGIIEGASSGKGRGRQVSFPLLSHCFNIIFR